MGISLNDIYRTQQLVYDESRKHPNERACLETQRKQDEHVNTDHPESLTALYSIWTRTEIKESVVA